VHWYFTILVGPFHLVNNFSTTTTYFLSFLNKPLWPCSNEWWNILRSRGCLTSQSWLLVPGQVIHNINFKLLYTLHRIKLLSFGPYNSGMRWHAIIVIVPRDREAMTAKNRTRKLAFVPNARCKSNRRRRIHIAIARGAGMATTIVERTTVNSPFTNKGGEDGGESRVSASERSCIDRPGTKKQARERSEPDQVPALDYVYVRFAALFPSFSPSRRGHSRVCARTSAIEIMDYG